MKSQFGVFYQVYNNKKATEFVLENLRKHFPDNPVVLISDGGKDFSDISDKYNCSYHWRENIFGNSENNYDRHHYDAKRTIEWWNRQKLVSEETGMDYVMILEDDVLIKKPFSIDSLFYLRGVRTGTSLTNKMLEEINSLGYKAWIYGMCGGSIYNARVLLGIYDDVVKDIDENMDRLIKEDFMQWALLGSVDANIVYHFNKRGYKYEEAPWLAEVREGPICNGYPVIHQWKEYY